MIVRDSERTANVKSTTAKAYEERQEESYAAAGREDSNLIRHNEKDSLIPMGIGLSF